MNHQISVSVFDRARNLAYEAQSFLNPTAPLVAKRGYRFAVHILKDEVWTPFLSYASVQQRNDQGMNQTR